MLFLRLLDGSPTRTVLLFLSTQAYIIITKMWLCTVTVCVGVLRALWVYGIDFCRTKREEQESEVSQSSEERGLLNRSLIYFQCGAAEFTAVFHVTSVKTVQGQDRAVVIRGDVL